MLDFKELQLLSVERHGVGGSCRGPGSGADAPRFGGLTGPCTRQFTGWEVTPRVDVDHIIDIIYHIQKI